MYSEMYQVNLIMRVQVLSSFVERSFYFDTKTKSIPTFNYLKKLLTLPLSKQKDFFYPPGGHVCPILILLQVNLYFQSI